MKFEEWFEKWWGEHTDGPYKSVNVESIARAAWEAATLIKDSETSNMRDSMASLCRTGVQICRRNDGGAKKMTDTQQKLDKLTEHITNLEAEVALLNNAVSAQPTLRDSMAAHALTGLLACPMSGTPSSFSKLAYKYADAMLKEREK